MSLRVIAHYIILLSNPMLDETERLTKWISERGAFVITPDPKLPEIWQQYENHSTFHEGDSGLDLFCPQDLIVPARSLGTKIDLGVIAQSGQSFWMLPRSSISKTPLRLANSVGLIDAGYRGHLIAMVDNHSDTDYHVQKGQRLFQIATGDLQGPIKFTLSSHVLPTSRGAGGFGSTG